MNIKSETEIQIPAGNIHLTGGLVIPEGAASLVIFSHGSGSSRLSPRNNYVATFLHKEKTATLLIDLLTTTEDTVYENRFNIELLTERLTEVTEYVEQMAEAKNFSLGYFGASTGAASAFRAAAKMNSKIKA